MKKETAWEDFMHVHIMPHKRWYCKGDRQHSISPTVGLDSFRTSSAV